MHGTYEVFSGERIVVLVMIVKIHHYILYIGNSYAKLYNILCFNIKFIGHGAGRTSKSITHISHVRYFVFL